MNIVELIEQGTARSYESALQLCIDGIATRPEITQALSIHMSALEGVYRQQISVRIKMIYKAYFEKGLTVAEATQIIEETQRRLTLKDRRYDGAEQFALRLGFARDIFMEAIGIASSFEEFLALSNTLVNCAMKNGCKEQRDFLFCRAINTLSRVEEVRDIYNKIIS